MKTLHLNVNKKGFFSARRQHCRQLRLGRESHPLGPGDRQQVVRGRLGQLRQHDDLARQEEEAVGRRREERKHDPRPALKIMAPNLNFENGYFCTLADFETNAIGNFRTNVLNKLALFEL